METLFTYRGCYLYEPSMKSMTKKHNLQFLFFILKLNSSFPQDTHIRFFFDLVGNAYVVSLNSRYAQYV